MTASIVLPPDYKPSADEEYMNDMQLEYFRQKLENWKKSIVSQSVDTLADLRQGGLNQPDEIDRASMETDKSLDLRTKDRIRKLISKIDPFNTQVITFSDCITVLSNEYLDDKKTKVLDKIALRTVSE